MKALSGVLSFVLAIALCILLPAWTLDYWQAWVLISVLFVSLLGIVQWPHSKVRHPMYVGALIMILGVPLALGSWWGTATIVPMTLVVMRRVRDEEELLTRDLTGCRDQVR